MAVIADILDGQLRRDQSGYHTTRTFIVTDVTGDPAGRRVFALQTPDVPAYGDPHPFAPDCFCLDQSVEPLPDSPDAFRIVCSYDPYTAFEEQAPPSDNAPGIIRVGSTLNEVQTMFDKLGNQMKISGRVRRDYPGNDVDGVKAYTVAEIKDQPVQVRKQVPSAIRAYSRREFSDPSQKAENFIGRVNVAPIWDRPARSWLCTRIEGQSDDGGITYQVDYEFQYNPDTWDATVSLVDPETGEPAPLEFFAGVLLDGGEPVNELVSQQFTNETKTFQIYEEADFFFLNL